jgi:hypothetical protein
VAFPEGFEILNLIGSPPVASSILRFLLKHYSLPITKAGNRIRLAYRGYLCSRKAEQHVFHSCTRHLRLILLVIYRHIAVFLAGTVPRRQTSNVGTERKNLRLPYPHARFSFEAIAGSSALLAVSRFLARRYPPLLS